MSRCVLVSTMGDPYLIILWFNANKKWFDLVDRVYLHINTTLPKDIVEFTLKYVEHPKLTCYYADHQLDHGPALAYMLEHASEDVVMLMEDDSYILKPDYMDEQFKDIESGTYDIIGSRRGSTDQYVIDKMGKKFGVDTTWRNGGGAAYWPCFLFTTSKRLLDTDRHFHAKQWKKGDYIKELDCQIAYDTAADTFVWTSIQLMLGAPKMKDVKQYHAYPHWESDKREKVNVFSPDCPWIHVGSLSGGIMGMLVADNGWPMASYHTQLTPREVVIAPKPTVEDEYLEYQRRIAFYRMGHELYANETEPIKEFRDMYVRAINRACEYLHLDSGDIEAQKNAFRNLIGL